MLHPISPQSQSADASKQGAVLEHNKLLGIQAARGIAAVVVVLYHAGRMVSLDQYVGYIPMGGFFNFGHSGVDFFFTLSGFIIYFVHNSDFNKPRALLRYTWRRLTRIYPIYWVVTIVLLTIGFFKPDGGGLPNPVYLAKSVLLLPQALDPFLGVAWTLEHEMLFYLLFACAIVNRHLGAVVFVVWTTVILCGFATNFTNTFFLFVASPYHLQFFMGAAAAQITINLPIPSSRLLAAIGVVAFFAIGMIENLGLVATAGVASQLLFGIAAACILLGVARAEMQGLFQVGPVSAFVGGASYSLYLSHTIAIGLTAHLLMAIGVVKAAPGWIFLIVVAVIAVMSGSILYQFVERPMLDMLNRIGRTHVYGRKGT